MKNKSILIYKEKQLNKENKGQLKEMKIKRNKAI